MNYFDENEVRKTIAIMKPDGKLFEVRIIYGDKRTYSGYFKSADDFINAVRKMDLKRANVYITLNEVDESCESREQFNCFVKGAMTTSDDNIVGYEWLLIDLDPKRASGTSSSEQEMEDAKKVGNSIYQTLRNMGFERPVFAYSGNGVHLLYKIHIANTKENAELIKKCLQAIHMLFSDGVIDIDVETNIDADVKNYNASRITKCYGFLSQKGRSTKDRPHRMSKIIGNVADYESLKPTPIAYLKKLASVIPEKQETPQQYNGYNPQKFDVEQWMDKYGIEYDKVQITGGTKYVLNHCPFNENHKGKDAVVFRRDNGALSFFCFHSSCADKHWKEFRQHFEPNAYEKQWMEEERKMYSRYNRNRDLPKPQKIEAKPDEPVFLTPKLILARGKQDEEFIKTGITTIDRKMRGLKKKHVSVWSGLRSSGKSSLLSQIALYAVHTGNNVGFYSGELTPDNFMTWMNLQAAGKAYVKPGQYEGFYSTPIETQEKIADWLEGHFFLYNNVYGNNYQAVMKEFVRIIEENKLDLLILDNLMAFNISDMGNTKWEAQTAFVWDLTQIAKDKNVHIAFVAHPRKAQGFLRFDDISGTADLGNAVDDAFIVHRNNNDFKRLSAQMFEWHDDNEVYDGTNVVEIVKDRDGGNQDVFIPLYYEVESKRLKNDRAENVIYGWKDDTKPQEEPKVNFPIETFEPSNDTPFD